MNGKFYNREGEVPEGQIKIDILDTIKQGTNTSISQKVDSLFKALCMQGYIKAMPSYSNRIPLKNGTVTVFQDKFVLNELKDYAPYRLNVELLKEVQPTPWFDKWLTELVYEDDIPVVQEMLGYFLLPTTMAQKCFIFLGAGGNGKSIWGYLLENMLGNAFISRRISDIESNRFALPDLENKLVCYNDDLTKKALNSTEMFKQLVTATSSVTAERKYANSYKFIPYARIIACANFMLSSINDDSDGFFRRIIPIVIKPRPIDRTDITDLHIKVTSEKNGILQWALLGLQRLIKNNYQFSVTNRSEECINESRETANNIQKFIDDDLIFDNNYLVSNKELVSAYKKWCFDNAESPKTDADLRAFFKERKNELNITYSENIVVNGSRARGYRGLGLNKQRGRVIIK